MVRFITVFLTIGFKCLGFAQFQGTCDPDYELRLSGSTPNCLPYHGYVTVFRDDFDGNELDMSVWRPHSPLGGLVPDPNVIVSIPQNVVVQNGYATLSTAWSPGFYNAWEWVYDSYGNIIPNYIYAQFNSAELWTFIYKFEEGRFHARCKLPNQPQTNGAFWLWQESNDCKKEIDIFETLFDNTFPYKAFCSIHKVNDCSGNELCNWSETFNSDLDKSQTFNEYVLEWDRNNVIWKFNNGQNTEVMRHDYSYWSSALGTQQNYCADLATGYYIKHPIFPDHSYAMKLAFSHKPRGSFLNNPNVSSMQIDYVYVEKPINCSVQVDLCHALQNPTGDNFVLGGTIHVGGVGCDNEIHWDQYLKLFATNEILISNEFEVIPNGIFTAEIVNCP